MYHSKEKLPIIPTTGIFYPLTSISPPLKATSENSLNFSKNFLPKKYTPNSNNLSLTTAMPSHSPIIKKDNLKIINGAPIKSEGKNSIFGYRSGARSALIPIRESNINDNWIIAYLNNKKYTPDNNGKKFFRLKGCGMYNLENKLNFPGITIQDAEYLREENKNNFKYIEIRGVCFINTSSSELYCLNMLKCYFDKLNILLGNIPIGFWEYKNLNNDPAPLINKCVTIMETFGDKRLETHLFTGIEKIFQEFFNSDNCEKCINEINDLYIKNMLNPPSDNNRTYSRANKFPYNNFTEEMKKCLNDDSFPILIKDFFDYDDNLIKYHFLPTEKIIKILEKYDDIYKMGLFYCKLGYEIGRILSLIHRRGFVWGTYVDYDTMGIHCNAHGDNMIILSKEQARKKNNNNNENDNNNNNNNNSNIENNNDNKYQILAPIDFDMSFNYENAINVWEEKSFNDITIVTDHFYSEVNSLGGDIAGTTSVIEDVFTNIRAREQPKGFYNNLIWVLRDIIYIEFIKSYNNPLRDEIYNINIDDAYYIIDKALEASNDIES